MFVGPTYLPRGTSIPKTAKVQGSTFPLVSYVITLTDASESRPKHAAVPSQQGSSPWRRSFPATVPCPSTSLNCSGSCANSLRLGWPSAELRFGLPAKPVTATVGPRTPSLRLTLQDTRSFADSAHSAQVRAPSSPHRFRSGSEIWLASVQRCPGHAQSPKRKCSRCTNTPTSRRPAPVCSDQSARGRNRLFRKVAPGE